MDSWIALIDVGVAMVGVAIALVSAVIGGCIAGWFTLRGVERQAALAREVQAESERALVLATLQAIHTEIEVVFLRYQNSMGVKIEALGVGEILNYHYPVSSDYFSVYGGNAAQVGRLPKINLQKSIVATYVMFRGLRDSYEINNRYLDDYESALRRAEDTGSFKQHEQNRELKERLVEYAGALKIFHVEVRQKVEAIRLEFEEAGVDTGL